MTFRVQAQLPPSRAVIRKEKVDWSGGRQAMIDNPGWVLIAENVHASTGDQLRKGMYPSFRDDLDRFEFRAVKPQNSDYGPRRTDIWGRYTPVGYRYDDDGALVPVSGNKKGRK